MLLLCHDNNRIDMTSAKINKNWVFNENTLSIYKYVKLNKITKFLF
jgi:hypothetical protein